MNEVRESRIEVKLHQEKVDFWCLWKKGLEYKSLRRCFNSKEEEGIDWIKHTDELLFKYFSVKEIKTPHVKIVFFTFV